MSDHIQGVQKGALMKLASVKSWPVERLFGMCPPHMLQSLVLRGLVTTDDPIVVEDARRGRKGVPRQRKNYARITDEGRAVLAVLRPSTVHKGSTDE